MRTLIKTTIALLFSVSLAQATLINATDVYGNGSIDDGGRAPANVINGLTDSTSSIFLPGGSSDALGNYRQDTTGINNFGGGAAWAIRGDVSGGTQNDFSSAWLIVDLGGDYSLDGIDIFTLPLGDTPNANNINRALLTGDVYYAPSSVGISGSAGSITVGGNLQDVQFGTLLTNELVAFNTSGFTSAGSVTFGAPLGNETNMAPFSIALTGQTARFIAVANMTSNDTDDLGFGEIQAFGTAVPEPSSFALFGLGFALMFFSRRRQR